MSKGISKPESVKNRRIQERYTKAMDRDASLNRNQQKADIFNAGSSNSDTRARSLALDKQQKSKTSGETIYMNRKSQENLK